MQYNDNIFSSFLGGIAESDNATYNIATNVTDVARDPSVCVCHTRAPC